MYIFFVLSELFVRSSNMYIFNPVQDVDFNRCAIFLRMSFVFVMSVNGCVTGCLLLCRASGA